MEAQIIKHHPKMLDRWAKNVVGWYKSYGAIEAQKRSQFMTSMDIDVANPVIKEEFKKQGYKI